MDNKTPREIFAKRFKDIRTACGMSQADFAAFVGISRPTVGFYENGDREPDATTLARIAKQCGVSADFLVGLSDNSTVETAGIDKTLGLSTKAIQALKESPEVQRIIDRLLSSVTLPEFVNAVSEYNLNKWTIAVYKKKLSAEDDVLTQELFEHRISSMEMNINGILSKTWTIIEDIFSPLGGEAPISAFRNDLREMFDIIPNSILKEILELQENSDDAKRIGSPELFNRIKAYLAEEGEDHAEETPEQ